MDYLDFAIEVHTHSADHYVVAVRSPTGEARTTTSFPFTAAALESHLLKLENAILRSAGRRRGVPTPEEEAVQSFGRELFTFLLRDELLSRFRACQQLAHDGGQGVRIKLSVTPPDLAGLPWEFLYDPARRDYLCLDPNTPLVRYPELPLTIQPLPVTPPLRILGLCIDATDLTRLDVAEEQARMEQAVQNLRAQGRVELTWLPGQSADDLQRAMRRGPWHVLHFIGHGSFDQVRDEGMILLADDAGKAAPLYATQLARLLARQRQTLRLVLLNACEGARGGRQDLFSSTATVLVGSGIPAVLAMQYDITDAAAVQFARTFYEALADNLPVDTAVADARNAMTLRNRFSLEWGTPVLYLRAPDGRMFDVVAEPTVPVIPVPIIPAPTATTVAPPLPAASSEQPNLLTFVRAILAHLYSDESDARRVVADAGLAADRIAFSGHATNNWHAILTEAEKSGKVRALLMVALKEYGENQTVQAAYAAYLGVADGMDNPAMPSALDSTPLSTNLPYLRTVAPIRIEPSSFKSATSVAKDKKINELIDLDLVHIPAGDFLMGSDPRKDDLAEEDEQPQYSLYLPDYYIARTPVTNRQYEIFVQVNGYRRLPHWENGQIPIGKEDHPVVGVDWKDAISFCRWLSQATGHEFRLPNEAEWEKAARGTNGPIYPWGNEWEAGRCNTKEADLNGTTPVDAYPTGASPYGVLDMVGNVWEWCATKRDKQYVYGIAKDEWTAEYLMQEGGWALRGGSWSDIQTVARCAFRKGRSFAHKNFGFRVVYTILH